MDFCLPTLMACLSPTNFLAFYWLLTAAVEVVHGVAVLDEQTVSATTHRGGLNQKLLVVSFDGFRQAYFNENRFLPWLTMFRQDGVYSDQVQSIFPSETFPNHFAIVTGMYAESHGIVANAMYDPKLNLSFTKNDADAVWWGGAEPIWITAVRQGKRSAVWFWPGSYTKYPPMNFTPTYYQPAYDASYPVPNRIDEIVSHLEKDKVDVAFLYYNQPDSDGHAFGAPSANVNEKLQTVDWYLSYLLKKLEDVNLGKDNFNIVICADHGMTNVTQILYLEDYVSMSTDIERVPSFGPVVNIQPKPGRLNVVMSLLRNASSNGAPFRAYRKREVPPEFHYSNHYRIMDIVVICNLGVFLKTARPSGKTVVGTHGYDPRLPQMKPIFMARGPAFKKAGYKAKNVFETKDIYAIIAYITGIQPLATNASFERVMDIFTPSNTSTTRLLLLDRPLLALLYFLSTSLVDFLFSRSYY